MTIKYLAGNRIQGVSYGEEKWSDAVVGSNISVNLGAKKIDFNGVTNNASSSVSYDLGSTSDSQWTLRMKYEVTAWTNPSSATNYIFIGISDSPTESSSTAQDFIGFQTSRNLNGSIGRELLDTDGVAVLGASGVAMPDPIEATIQYIEINRTSSTEATCKIFSDSTYTTQVGSTATAVVASGTTNLRHIKIMNRDNVSNGGSLIGYITDLKFWDGTNTTSGTPTTLTFGSERDTITNVPLGTVFEETDTGKHFLFDTEKTTPTYETDFSSNSGWATATSTDEDNLKIDTTAKMILSNNPNIPSNPHQLCKDLGSTLSNTAWVLDIDLYVIDNENGGSNWTQIGMHNVDEDSDDDDNQNFLGMLLISETGKNHVGLISPSNGTLGNFTPESGFDDEIADGAQFYFRLIRDGADTLTLERHSSSARTDRNPDTNVHDDDSENTSTATNYNNVTGLQFFKISFRTASNGGTQGTQKFRIENLKIYDGVENSHAGQFKRDGNWSQVD
jgi:hypothetical protein